jgi:hypothetical protein
MEHERPRWRIRISTLMLLVIIAALSLALVVEALEKMARGAAAHCIARTGGGAGPAG